MASFREDVNSSFPDEEDTCSSCFNSTKYCCLYCGIALCNKCAVFEENEDTPGWTAGKENSYKTET